VTLPAAMPAATATPIRVGVAGSRGYGRVHLERLGRLMAGGAVELVGVADPAGRSEFVPQGVPWFGTLGALLAVHACDLVIVSTPIHTHEPLAEQAMRAGAHVYLEKPPVASLPAFQHLLDVAAETGRVCQVGFQSIGSSALGRIAELVDAGALGTVRIVSGTAAWKRDKAYFDRSDWAGRRRFGDVVVADGVATNALAHSVAQALRVVGTTRLDQVVSVTTELYKANVDNESDDTTFVRVDSDGAVPVSCALTLCDGIGAEPPKVDVIGDRGRVSLSYTLDVLDLDLDGRQSRETFDRVDLVENLLDHLRDPGVDLLNPLADNGAYMAVLQAIQDAPEPTPILEQVEWVGTGPQAHVVVAQVADWVRQAADTGTGFAAVGAPWASPAARVRWSPEG